MVKNCGTCEYSIKISPGFAYPGNNDSVCNYLEVFGKRRPCSGINCTEWAEKTEAHNSGKPISYTVVRKRRPKLDCEKAMVLYLSGMSDKAICRKLQVSHSTVANWRKKNNLPPSVPNPHSGRPVSLNYDVVRKLYEQGKNDTDIAKELSCSHGAISRWRRKNDLAPNRRKRK